MEEVRSNFILRDLEAVGALITDSHLVYASGKHGSAYVNKDAVYPHTRLTSALCYELADHFAGHGVEAVIAPAVGGVILATWTAHHLSAAYDGMLCLYADKTNTDGFEIKRGYEKLVPGKKILVVEDVLTTGGSVAKVIAAVRSLGGEVVGVGALCNRGGVTAEALGVPEIFALVNVNLESWPEEECPLCAQGVSVNTSVGKGREFLERKVVQRAIYGQGI